MKTLKIVLVTLFALAASGCANTDPRPTSSSPSSSQPSNSSVVYGVIDSIETTRENSNEIGAGAIIGGVVGGILGHQVGGGMGNDVATIAGVAGGAVVGHQIENRNKQQDVYRIKVRLDRGGNQIVIQQNIPDLRVGDQVRIENNQVSRY